MAAHTDLPFRLSVVVLNPNARWL